MRIAVERKEQSATLSPSTNKSSSNSIFYFEDKAIVSYLAVLGIGSKAWASIYSQ